MLIMSEHNDEIQDYGFELPDNRSSYIDKEGATVEIHIIRDWHHHPEDPETVTYACRFEIKRQLPGELMRVEMDFPRGIDQCAVEKVARLLYPEDPEASQAIYEMRAIEAGERRVGA